jgi:long-chain acyl-CoA synthetase
MLLFSAPRLAGGAVKYGTSSLGHFLPFLAYELKERRAVTYFRGYRTYRYSYREMFLFVRKVSAFLLEKGLRKGDTVLVFAGNCPEYASLLLACGATGIIVVPVDANSGRELVDRIITATSPKMIVTDNAGMLGDRSCISVDIDRLWVYAHACDPALLDSFDGIVDSDDIFEIVYTSGTTQDPKGVVITHRNIVSNLRALRLRIRYNPSWKFLSLLPLSHLFEQTTGCLAPLRFGCEVIYCKYKRFSETSRIIRDYGITSIVAVPAVLAIFKSKIEAAAAQRGNAESFAALIRTCAKLPFVFRRLCSFPVRRNIGSRFDFFVCGGGPLSPQVENFWENLGVRVVQGYGLTEASPIVSCNSYETRIRGSVGRVLKEQQIKIDADGEILVAGDNIIREYFRRPDLHDQYFRDGWYTTGDIGRMDARGNLYLTGRKKNMLVGPDGINVFPEDIEAVLIQIQGIKESVVFGDAENGPLRLCAAVICASAKLDLESVKQQVNARLNPAQRLSRIVLWPDESFPMTPTLKIRRADVAKEYARLKQGTTANATTPPQTVTDRIVLLVARLADQRPEQINKDTRLVSGLGFDSLKITELAVLLENMLKNTVDETKFGNDPAIVDIEKCIAVSAGSAPTRTIPQWPQGSIAVFLRRLIFPVFRLFLKTVYGVRIQSCRVKFPLQRHPVIYVANHQSHLDTVAVLSSMHAGERGKTVVAAAADYFFERWNPGMSIMSFLLNMFPFFRKDRFSVNLSTIGRFIDSGNSVLIFPEGTRSRDGAMGPFKNGIGVIVREMKIPVVPVKIRNTFTLLPYNKEIPARGVVETVFGAELRFDSKDPCEITAALEKAVALLE